MVDQAILYLRLRGDAPDVQGASSVNDQPPKQTARKADEPLSALEYLRGYGIRTATDLLYVWRTQDLQGSPNFEDMLKADCAEFANRIKVIVNTLEKTDWVPQLQYRRRQVTQLHEKPVEDPASFFDKEQTDVGWRGNSQ
jgi:hypothetical protein